MENGLRLVHSTECVDRVLLCMSLLLSNARVCGFMLEEGAVASVR